jgi:hypothetical protein
MNGIGKIVGFPVKLFHYNRIYVPFEYLRYYGISEKHDKLLVSKSDRGLFYRPLPRDGIEYSRKETVSIRGGLITLSAGWVRQNEITPGDFVFMLGTTDGLLVYVKK